ncbi:hypothetical protein CLOM_g8311 [Closterium sp. NIES-68]|nr:hypothetical protein CLOM_g8311 [Closterium sp. NIES-68]
MEPPRGGLRLALRSDLRFRRSGRFAERQHTVNILGRAYGQLKKHYRLGPELGCGAAGSTYLTQCLRPGQHYGQLFACKSIEKARLAEPDDVDAVRTEVAAMEVLQGAAQVVRLHEVLEDEQAVHVIMELCEGGDLFNHLLINGRFPERTVAHVVKTLADALVTFERVGLVHRDLKLENIFVSGIASTEITASGNSGDGFSDGFPGASFGVHCADFYGASGGVKCSESQGFCAGAGGLVTIATSGSSGSCASSSSRCDYNVHRTTNKHDYSSSGSFGSSSSSSGRTAANHAQLNSSECTHSSNRSSFSACSGSITYSRCFCHTSGVTNRGNDSSPFSLPSSRSGVVPTWTAATAANNVQGTRGEKLRNAAPIRVRVGDFGVSAFVKPGEKLSSVTGSPYYIAPEVLQNYYGPEADVWSLGIVVYMLLCGYPPFFADEPVGIFEKVLGGGDADVSHGPWKSISGQAKDLVSRLLVRDPAKRIRPSRNPQAFMAPKAYIKSNTLNSSTFSIIIIISSSSSSKQQKPQMTARCGPSFKPLRPLSVQLPTQDSPHDSPHQHSARSLRHQSARSRHLPSAMSPHDLSISVPQSPVSTSHLLYSRLPSLLCHLSSALCQLPPPFSQLPPLLVQLLPSFSQLSPSFSQLSPALSQLSSPLSQLPSLLSQLPPPLSQLPRPSIKHISGGVKNKGGGEKKEGRGNKGRAWHKGDLSRSGSLERTYSYRAQQTGYYTG